MWECYVPLTPLYGMAALSTLNAMSSAACEAIRKRIDKSYCGCRPRIGLRWHVRLSLGTLVVYLVRWEGELSQVVAPDEVAIPDKSNLQSRKSEFHNSCARLPIVDVTVPRPRALGRVICVPNLRCCSFRSALSQLLVPLHQKKNGAAWAVDYSEWSGTYRPPRSECQPQPHPDAWKGGDHHRCSVEA